MKETKFRYIFEDIKEDGRTLVTQFWNLNDIETNDIVYDTEVLVARDQYTELKDKNGLEIYEGDIIKRNLRKNETKEKIFTVTMSDLELLLKIKNSGGYIYEVIGNIYDNPDLLKA